MPRAKSGGRGIRRIMRERARADRVVLAERDFSRERTHLQMEGTFMWLLGGRSSGGDATRSARAFGASVTVARRESVDRVCKSKATPALLQAFGFVIFARLASPLGAAPTGATWTPPPPPSIYSLDGIALGSKLSDVTSRRGAVAQTATSPSRSVRLSVSINQKCFSHNEQVGLSIRGRAVDPRGSGFETTASGSLLGHICTASPK